MISLIIPLYNNENYIDGLMENLRNLKKKNKEIFEIIFIDDCGNRETFEKIKLNKFKDYKIISHEQNLGLGGARNTGVENSSFDWIMFLDGDDTLAEKSIDILVQKIKDNPSIDAIEYGYMEIYNKFQREFNVKKEKFSKEFFNIPSWTKLIRKDKYIPFENHIKHEDLDNFIQYTSVEMSILHLNEVLYFYNKENENSITTKNWTKDLRFIVNKNKNKNKKTNQILTNSLLYYAKTRKEYMFSLCQFLKSPSLTKNAFLETKNKISKHKKKYKIYFIMPSRKQKVYLMGTPIHGNIGDHAITKAELKILGYYYDKKQIKIIEGIHNYIVGRIFIKNRDIICIQGGGNVGDLYPDEMKYRINLVKKFPKNKKLFFTKSIYFENEENEKLLLDQLFSGENNVFLSRENKTFKMVNKYENVTNFLIPDVVNILMQNNVLSSNNRILLLKREDIEKVVNTNHLIESIKIHDQNRELVIDDTIKSSFFDLSEGDAEVEKILKKISESSIVITDRLHGMILSYISDVPVIVLPGNIKIEESYNLWYKDCPKVRFISKIDELNQELIDDLINLKYKNHCLFSEELITEIMESLNE